MSLQNFYDFAVETAWQAGRLTLGYYQTGLRPDFKADDSPVTLADKEAEQFIRSRIESRFPDHAIVGEEYGVAETEGATHRWFVDPIDGTKSFMRGVPLYAVLIGLEIEGRIEAGACYFPALDEMVSAATGLGCWWNGRRARVSAETDLSRSIIAHIDTASFAKYGDKGAAWQRLQQASYYNAGWCDAYGYALVATGRVEVALDPIVNAWDCGPFPVIMREAGGYYGDWQGNETMHAGEALATNWQLLPEVLALLNGSTKAGA
jgi:myo-inositol-1(or 4)-monophosphatase